MSKFSTNYRDFADQVRAAADIVEVVSQYVELKRAGANHKGCCPFHQEKTPSFNVHPGKQIFKCFGCGKGGDVITFVREIERADFLEALKILAEKYNLEIPTFQANGPDEQQIRHRQTLGEILEEAVRFHKGLLAHPQKGATVRRYIEERGMSPEIVEKFALGMVEDEWSGLTDHLKSRGYTTASIVEAGLARMNKSGSGCYDYLRDRLIFPIANARGATIAFGGRILKGDGPKYINSPETPLFQKGRELYGLFQARDTLTRGKQPAILVEGYMDVIACHQAGLTSAIASMGTSLTPEQARLMRRYSPEAVFLYDADDAGIKAILRGLEVLVSANLSVRVGILPVGEDPDSYAKKNGAEALGKVIETAIPYFDFILDQAAKRHNLDSPEESVRALELFQPVFAAIPEKLVLDGYITKLAVHLGHDELTLRQYLKKHTRRAPVAQRPAAPATPASSTPRSPSPPTSHSAHEPPPPDAPPPDIDLDYDPDYLAGAGFESEGPSLPHPPQTVDPAPVAASVIPIGASPPTPREKGLLRILIEHPDARVVAREKLDPLWVENEVVRFWVKNILELQDESGDPWPALMASCQEAPEHKEFLHTVIFTTDEPLDTDYLPILDHLIALMESAFRLLQNRRLNQKIARMAAEKNLEGIEDLTGQQMQNLKQRISKREEATKDPITTRV